MTGTGTKEQRPLPPLLLTLTVVTGMVDPVSTLRLGRVFVANMTGNVVFSGFALVGAPGLSGALGWAGGCSRWPRCSPGRSAGRCSCCTSGPRPRSAWPRGCWPW
jgi:hypothetical protein